MKNNKSTYSQLTQYQRYQISAWRQVGKTIRAISKTIGCHFSTVSRELKRNSSQNGYNPEDAHNKASLRRETAHKASKQCHEIDKFVRSFLRLGWSPEAISLRLKHEGKANSISYTTIYRRIDNDKSADGVLHTYLPRYGKTRWKGGKRNKAGVSQIPNRIDIKERPEIVEKRMRIGDWEGDTVHGQNAHPVTLVNRKTRYTLATKVLTKTKENVGNAIIYILSKVPHLLTLTLDNGGEFADHGRVSEVTGIECYFAKPYTSWQRGTNENTNGRLRRLWPKKFDIVILNEEDIQREIFLLNLTPRKVLNGLTPLETFTGSRVALIA